MIEIIKLILGELIKKIINKPHKRVPLLIEKISEFISNINKMQSIIDFYTLKKIINVDKNLSIFDEQVKEFNYFENLYLEIKNLDVNNKIKNVDEFWKQLKKVINYIASRAKKSIDYQNAKNCSDKQIYMKQFLEKFDSNRYYFKCKNNKCIVEMNIIKQELKSKNINLKHLSKMFEQYKKSLEKQLK